jgi:hypothetical protein
MLKKKMSIPVLVLTVFLTILPLSAQQTTTFRNRTSTGTPSPGGIVTGATGNASSVANLLTPATPLQLGFAVITPASGNGAGLAALETVGNQVNSNFSTSALPAAPLMTQGALVVDLSDGSRSFTGPFASSLLNSNNPNSTTTGTGATTNTFNGTNSGAGAAGRIGNAAALPLFANTALSIINPNSGTATITFTLNAADGGPVPGGSLTMTLDQLKQVSRFVNEIFTIQASSLTQLEGVLTFRSDIPVAVTALEFRGSLFSTLPVIDLSTLNTGSGTAVTINSNAAFGATTNPLPLLAPGVGGAGSLLLPQFVMGGGWATRITIANLSNAPQTVRIDLFSSNGSALSTGLDKQSGSTFMNLVVPANGVLVLGPQDSNGLGIF